MTDSHPIPDAWSTLLARRSRNVFGVLALFFLCIEVLTGVLLLVYYRPSAAAAYTSTAMIMDSVRLGWMVRGIHWWSGDFLILCSLLHLIRVYFSRAYAAAPRWTWVTGIFLLILALAFSFTGTLLPWDQYAYWEVDASRQTIAAVPLFGNVLLNVFWGGWELGEEVLLRFFAVHVGILPWIALIFIGVHFVLVWRTAAQRSVIEAVEVRSAAANLDTGLGFAIAALLVLGGLVSLAVLAAPPLGVPADPLLAVAVQPRWYFLPARWLLRHMSGGMGAVTVGGLFVVLLAVPFIDRGTVESSRGKTVRWVLGGVVVGGWILLALRQYFA